MASWLETNARAAIAGHEAAGPVIGLSDASKSFGGTVALRHVSLT